MALPNNIKDRELDKFALTTSGQTAVRTIVEGITVDAPGLIVELDHTEDSVSIGDGTDLLAINADGSINTEILTTNIDIRDLTHVTDSVQIGDGVDTLSIVSGRALIDGSEVTQPISAVSLPLPTGAATSANQTTIIEHVDGIEPLLTTIDSDTSLLAGTVSGDRIRILITQSSTGTTSQIAASATSVTLLVANSLRVGASIVNDSTKILRIKMGTGATSTSFTAVLIKDAYFEIPFNYTGIITGYWESATGFAYATEYTI